MRVSGFYEASCTNGEGWRSVLFMAGCPHHCPGCHNPETWSFDSGEECPDIEEYIKKILRNRVLIDGVTLSGGEPFQERNISGLHLLTERLRKEGLNVWCYSGYTWDELRENEAFFPLLQNLDVLVDGPYLEEFASTELKFRGSSNQRIIDVQASLCSNSVVLYAPAPAELVS